jgi:hypothetical protein
MLIVAVWAALGAFLGAIVVAVATHRRPPPLPPARWAWTCEHRRLDIRCRIEKDKLAKLTLSCRCGWSWSAEFEVDA